MDDMLMRFAADLVARVDGPMKMRLLLQPTVAMYFATRSGLRDATAGEPPYFWSLLTHPGHRVDMLKGGWKSIGHLFVAAFVIDVVYQLIAERFVFPGEAMVVAIALAIVPYLIVRGLVTRIAQATGPSR